MTSVEIELVSFPLGEHVRNCDDHDQGRQDGRDHQPVVGGDVAYGLQEILQPVQEEDRHSSPHPCVTQYHSRPAWRNDFAFGGQSVSGLLMDTESLLRSCIE